MNQTKKIKFSINPGTGCLSEEDARRYFSTVGLAVCALMLAVYLSSAAFTYLLYRFFPALLEHLAVTHALSLIPIYGIGLPIFCLILRRLPCGVPSGQPLSAWFLIGGFGVSIAMMSFGNTVSQFTIAFFESMMGRVQENPVAEITEGAPWWINLIFVALIPCILEELLFRKILCDRLLPLGEGYAVVLSAAVFGLVHGNFFQFFYAFSVGLIFAMIYVKTGRIWVTMVYHGIINLLGGVLAPWLLQKVAPAMDEAFLAKVEEYMAAENSEALTELLSPLMLPMLGVLLYEALMFVSIIVGIVFFFRRGRRMRLQSGLLPVPRSCRVSAVFLNAGVAAALTVFAGIFLLSLL
ncbi:MAG: CPBP family intramembrane metalloprotease [Clostridia bacterium]|nr:CPBP family intramembrane metalloprotease [Clostridia bacterium]